MKYIRGNTPKAILLENITIIMLPLVHFIIITNFFVAFLACARNIDCHTAVTKHENGAIMADLYSNCCPIHDLRQLFVTRQLGCKVKCVNIFRGRHYTFWLFYQQQILPSVSNNYSNHITYNADLHY